MPEKIYIVTPTNVLITSGLDKQGFMIGPKGIVLLLRYKDGKVIINNKSFNIDDCDELGYYYSLSLDNCKDLIQSRMNCSSLYNETDLSNQASEKSNKSLIQELGNTNVVSLFSQPNPNLTTKN